ncbi:transcriptional regulator [Paenibacillus sp. IB182496]|uniref:Transcriptional regulator n=1 Tax=Paenibacillus sabuli TaxID=2772509 RepID=A0A927BUB2_9BACL|nr:transcriptional regulator [Paenibacillus sabuli]MBD2845800.1 transcriptional regulator [Paenibacillus sabuli]
MRSFEEVYEEWLRRQIAAEDGGRRREMLRSGLGHGTVEFLRTIWFPAIGSLDHLYPEYECRDYNNGYRYLDLAYLPGDVKACIEIHGYRSHARDVEAGRFKDLCMKQALLVLDNWYFLPIAYLSIREDPELCKQLALSLVGKFLSLQAPEGLSWAEAETLRYARRKMMAFEPGELAAHLQLSENRTRIVLRGLVANNLLVVASGNQRYRTYRLAQSPRSMTIR